YGLNAAADIDIPTIEASADISDEIVDTNEINYSVSSVDVTNDILALAGDMLQLQVGDRVRVESTGDVPDGIDPDDDYFVVPYQFKDAPRLKLATSLNNALAGTTINISDAGSG